MPDVYILWPSHADILSNDNTTILGLEKVTEFILQPILLERITEMQLIYDKCILKMLIS